MQETASCRWVRVDLTEGERADQANTWKSAFRVKAGALIRTQRTKGQIMDTLVGLWWYLAFTVSEVKDYWGFSAKKQENLTYIQKDHAG